MTCDILAAHPCSIHQSLPRLPLRFTFRSQDHRPPKSPTPHTGGHTHAHTLHKERGLNKSLPSLCDLTRLYFLLLPKRFVGTACSSQIPIGSAVGADHLWPVDGKRPRLIFMLDVFGLSLWRPEKPRIEPRRSLIGALVFEMWPWLGRERPTT